MSTEIVESQEGQQDQNAQNAMMAGFNKVRGDEPSAEVPLQQSATPEQAVATDTDTTKTTQDATDTNTDEVVADKPAEKVEESTVEDDPIVPGLGLKASEVKAMLSKTSQIDKIHEAVEAKVSQKMFGKFGEIQRSINELKTPKEPAQTAKFTGEKLKRLQKEFPEIAEMLAEDLSEVLSAPAGSFTKEEVAQIVDEKLAETNPQVELKLLTIAHPDWYQQRHSQDFGVWLATLPEEISQQVQTSQDSSFLTKAFTGFKAWKASAVEAQERAAQEAAKATETAKRKQEKRLEGAVTPTGVTPPAPPTPTSSDAMMAGFKKVRPLR